MPATGCSPCAALPTMMQRPALVRSARLNDKGYARRPDLQEPAQPASEARLHFSEEFLVRPAHRRFGRRRAQRQDERAAAVGERQQRERPRGGEALVCHVLVKFSRQHGRDDRGLPVVAHLDADAERLAHRGLDPVGGHHQARPHDPVGARSRARPHPRGCRSSPRAPGKTRRDPRGPTSATRAPRRARGSAPRDPSASRPCSAASMRAKPKWPWSETWILAIRVAAVARSSPDPEGLENAAAAVRQRRGALIEARLRGRIVRHRLDERRAHAEPLRARRRGSRPPCRRRRWRCRRTRSGTEPLLTPTAPGARRPRESSRAPRSTPRARRRSPAHRPRCARRCSRTPSERAARGGYRSPARR